MTHTMRIRSIVFCALSMPVISAAAESVGRMVFQVVDQFGKKVPYRVESCTDSGGRDFASSFSGLEASRIPFGTYTYTLGRLDFKSDYAKIRGKVVVFHPERSLTLVADPTLIVGSEGVFASDRAVPADFVIRGRVVPMPNGRDPAWVRLQGAYEAVFAEAKVDHSGEFRVYEPLRGSFILCVVQNGEFLHVEPVAFVGSVHPDPLLIQLGEPPVVRAIH
jgi:hypothetical protein